MAARVARSRKHLDSPMGPTAALPGFGPKTTAALAAVGVRSLADLRSRDAYDLYRELKGRDPLVSLNFLYGILAAQEGCDWREVQRHRRTEILLVLDEMGLAPE
jgi:DNA transformation protein